MQYVSKAALSELSCWDTVKFNHLLNRFKIFLTLQLLDSFNECSFTFKCKIFWWIVFILHRRIQTSLGRKYLKIFLNDVYEISCQWSRQCLFEKHAKIMTKINSQIFIYKIFIRCNLVDDLDLNVRKLKQIFLFVEGSILCFHDRLVNHRLIYFRLARFSKITGPTVMRRLIFIMNTFCLAVII